MPERGSRRRRHASAEIVTSPIRWDRVGVVARRKRRLLVLCIALVGVVVTVAVASVAFVGKTALDPSFSPPILSRASIAVEVEDPPKGRPLVRGQHGLRGYAERAGIDVSGLEPGDVLRPQWSIRSTGRSTRVRRLLPYRSRVPSQPIVVGSDSEHRMLRKWIPMPRHSGRYVVELRLVTLDGRVAAVDKSRPFFVVGADCCYRYETPAYVAHLPKAWPLREDFTLNPGDRHVTLAIGPFGNSVDIDTSVIDPETADKNALYFQRLLEAQLAESGQEYRRFERRIYRAPDHGLVVEWSYTVEGDDFTDIFFYRGPSRFAVLGRSGEPHFRETRDLTRLIVRSLQAKPLGSGRG